LAKLGRYGAVVIAFAQGSHVEHQYSVNLPGSALAELYVRLRDEVDPARFTADPNDRVRAPIAMAILALSQDLNEDIVEFEERVRRFLNSPLPVLDTPARSMMASSSVALEIAGP
jgi:hypothetical protein